MLLVFSQPQTKRVRAEGLYLEHNVELTFYKPTLFYKLRPRSRNVLTLPHTILSHYLLCICPICDLYHSGFSFLLCHQQFLRISSHSLGRRHVVFFNHHTLPFLSLITHHLANNISITLKAGDMASLCSFIIIVLLHKHLTLRGLCIVIYSYNRTHEMH